MASGYRPYTSDSDAESESESDTSFTSDSSSSEYSAKIAAQVPNFRALAQGLSLTNMAGPATDSSGAQLDAEVLPLGFTLSKGYPTFKNYEIEKDPSGAELKSSSQSITSIIMLNSNDRDKNVFEQPTNVTLRLPRLYSNVTNFQLVQIKLL